MSKLLSTNKNFLLLLLNTERNQAIQLLKYITFKQVQVLSEIFLNLLHLKLNNSIKSVVKKRKKIVKLLGSKTVTTKKKIKLISAHTRQVLDTLQKVKKPLLQLLK